MDRGATAAKLRWLRRAAARPDPFAGELYGALAADRSYAVTSFDGSRLAVDEIGPPDARTGAVFLHGLGIDASVWHHQLAAVPPGMRGIFYDARGHGRSVPPGEGPAGLPALAGDLRAVLRASGLEAAVLVGHSMGGMTVLQLCRDHPGELAPTGPVRGLVLANTTSTDPLESLFLRPLSPAARAGLRRFAGWLFAKPSRWERLRRSRPGSLTAAVRWVGFAPGASPTQVRAMARFEETYTDDYLTALLASLLSLDLGTTLGTIGVPVLIFAGAQDRLTARRASEAMAARIPRAELRVIDRSGHMTVMERCDAVNPALEAFFRACLPAGTADQQPSGKQAE
jgi:pimeloyl-ACP methyl ester carboxylesterase